MAFRLNLKGRDVDLLPSIPSSCFLGSRWGTSVRLRGRKPQSKVNTLKRETLKNCGIPTIKGSFFPLYLYLVQGIRTWHLTRFLVIAKILKQNRCAKTSGRPEFMLSALWVVSVQAHSEKKIRRLSRGLRTKVISLVAHSLCIAACK